jgi:diguanylate cyclase (GGDEF)-like protein
MHGIKACVNGNTPSQKGTKRLAALVQQSSDLMGLEQAAQFGRWWYEPSSKQMALSAAATSLLAAPEQHHMCLDDCFIHVVADDVLRLNAHITAVDLPTTGFDFRIISPLDGMRWLRMSPVVSKTKTGEIFDGIIVDITEEKHAAMRERLALEMTEYLVGSHTLANALTNVIAIICKSLGWDWGAYWGMNKDAHGTPHLTCNYFWHRPELDLNSFGAESSTMTLDAGQGLVGSVWQSGTPDWVEDVANDLRFCLRTNDRNCRLWSGYAFPVSYTSAEGISHSPGVLEFYSCLTRQRGAQLPKISASIGAFIAQMAQRLAHQAAIAQLAQTDELTRLYNRRHFYTLLNHACVDAAKNADTFGLVFIDLDRFKPINDAFGHDAGNQVLSEFADRLRELAPVGSSVARLGGDEFALLVPGNAMQAPQKLMADVLNAASTPFNFEGVELTVSASVGVSMYPDGGDTGPALLQSADSAMYRVKNNGRNGFHVFADNGSNALELHQTNAAQQLALETELRRALQDNALFLLYQPIFNIASQRLDSVEALIRWRRQDGTMVPPDVFIPIAEQSHLIIQIGKWVVEQACRDLAILRANHFHDVKVHVNMAASEFANSALPQELRAQVDAFGLHPKDLSLELTEGMLMKRPDQVIAVMRSLRQMGFGISLDDFGMGHSSLALLKNLPITSLKIDRSFVRDVESQRNDRAIVKTIVDLGQQMELKVIAEGVETPEQLAFLKQSGCVLIQGYLIDKPLSIAQLRDKYIPCTPSVL